ncbi:caspase domain-containing protein [Xylanibacter ruminicola]|nr:caspase family protein [Xylanibacter ruminicola]
MANIIPKLKAWRAKRDYETTTEWQGRVNLDSQQRKVQDFLSEAIKEYTDKNPIQVTLGSYDADTEMYVLNTNYGKKYVKIPHSQAPTFKQIFSNAVFDVSYVMGDNYPQILNLTICFDDQQYIAEKSVVESSHSELAILPDLEVKFNKYGSQGESAKLVLDNSLDLNVPVVAPNSNVTTFAVIIGNERYTQVAHVPFANNDAKVFAEYCKKTLGLPEKNVKVYENASYGIMIGAVSDIQKIAKAFKGNINVIFYYAGHGIPDEATGDGYLLPIDADGSNIQVCYPLSLLYKKFGDMQVKSVTCFIDACFSGAQRGNGMIVTARGVAIKVKADNPMGNTVVFTAATDKQTAYPYEEKGHGMFTYYLLKKLRETKGDCTLGELGTYISDEVTKQAIVTNGKEQTPVVLTSQGIADSWKNKKLR